MSIITLTTDFGTGSPYVAAMKGVILSINPAATIVDITHAVPAQDIRHAAVVLEEVADRFPPGTIHVVVVDPGVGTDRGDRLRPRRPAAIRRSGQRPAQPGDCANAAVEDHSPGRAATSGWTTFPPPFTAATSWRRWPPG